jgi:hypothetical protein
MMIVPKSWCEFQHYKDRCPPWVRLHRKLLDNKDFHRLPDASRALAPMLWLLASESMDGEINAAVDELAFRLRRTEREIGAALKPLIDNGFFVLVQPDSTLLADGSHGAVPEALTETEAETEKHLTVLGDRAKAVPYKVPPCPYPELVQAYAELLPSLPQVAVLSDVRKSHLRERWREVCAAERFTSEQGIDWFRWYFGHAAKSPFLIGNGKPNRDGRVWRADFDWLLTPAKFARVVEGRYHGKAAA